MFTQRIVQSQTRKTSMRAERAVEPIKSENITVTWRRPRWLASARCGELLEDHRYLSPNSIAMSQRHLSAHLVSRGVSNTAGG
jgi:hypothetical protein